MTATALRFKPGDRVEIDTEDHRFAGRVFTVRAIERGKYQLDATDGGNGVRDVRPRTLIAPGEARRSNRWINPGTVVRYAGEKTVKYKATVILAPCDFGVVLTTKASGSTGALVVNVARAGGCGDQGLLGEPYARLSPADLDVVPVTGDVITALAAAHEAGLAAETASRNGDGQ
jgi:hypothetical protein